jgi:hypothetical protein
MRRLLRTTPGLPPDSPMSRGAFPAFKSWLNRIHSPNHHINIHIVHGGGHDGFW